MDVATFYLFTDLDGLPALRERWLTRGAQLGLRGTILLAHEGINGTLCGDAQHLETFLSEVRDLPPLAGLTWKFSSAAADNTVFHRFKIKIKPEIVTFGVPDIRPAERTGEHVDADTWNALLDDPDVVVIDTRNRYETMIGTFPGAVDPDTTNFREFPDYVRAHFDPAKHKKIAMFCTGGIRCEKAAAFMLNEGFETVYQLNGGILQYLEDTAEDGDNRNRWQGECFVFDQRVSVDATLQEGAFEQCFACRRPLSAEDLQSPDYRAGVSCPHCIEERPEAAREGFAERRRQVLIAEARGQAHIGVAQERRAANKGA